MSVLAGLKVANTSRRDAHSPSQRRRAKLVEKLEEQLQGAEALISGMSFQTTKRITRTDANGELERVTVPKRFRAWYWHDISGVWFLEVRYGARALKLDKSGATSIVVGERDKLVDIIGTVIEAVRAGELDAAIEEAAGTRVGLKRTKSRSSASA
jgi:hypothetical protein